MRKFEKWKTKSKKEKKIGYIKSIPMNEPCTNCIFSLVCALTRSFALGLRSNRKQKLFSDPKL